MTDITVFTTQDEPIADMAVGRGTSQPGTTAVGAMSLDSRPPADALAQVLALDAMDRAWIVKLPPAGQLPEWLGR